MKKICFIIMCLIVMTSLLLSACTKAKKKEESLIKYQRKLSQYTQNVVPMAKKGNVVDLSDGTQMQYNMKFAPNDPNFDVKLKDPYSY